MFNTYQLKQFAEKVIPKKYLRVAGMYSLRLSGLLYTGNTVKCPCCQHSYSSFASYGYVKRPNVLCRWCTSLERHRALWLYLHEKTTILTDKVKVLHFAPEHQFQELLKDLPNIDYLSADLDMPTAMVKVDITDIPFEDNSFDSVQLITMLHHTPDPEHLVREAKRVGKRVIVMEDIYSNQIQKYLTFAADSVNNREFIGHPHSNKTDKAWQALFQANGLRLKYAEYYQFLLFFRQVTYELISDD